MLATAAGGGDDNVCIECIRLDGVRLTVWMLQDATVGHLKAAVAAHQHGVPCGQQRLIFFGLALDDDAAWLSSLGITSESVVHLLPAVDGRGNSAKTAAPAAVLAADWRVYGDEYYQAGHKQDGAGGGGGSGGGDDDDNDDGDASSTAAAASRIRAEWEPSRAALRTARMEAAAHGLRQLVLPVQPRVFYYDPRDPARVFDAAGAELAAELAAREEEAAVERRAGLYGALHGELERALLRLGPEHASRSVEDVRGEVERVELQKTQSRREAERLEQEAAALRREAEQLRDNARAAASAEDFDGALEFKAESSKCDAQAAALEDRPRALRAAADVDLAAADEAMQALLAPVRLYEQLLARVQQLRSQRVAFIEKADYSQAKLVTEWAAAYVALGAKFAALAVVRVHSGKRHESPGDDYGDAVGDNGGGGGIGVGDGGGGGGGIAKAAPLSGKQDQLKEHEHQQHPRSFVFSVAAHLMRQEQRQQSQQHGRPAVSRELPVPVFDDSGGIFNDWVQLLPTRVCGRVLSEADPIFRCCAGAVGLFLRGTATNNSSSSSSSGATSATGPRVRAAAITATSQDAPSAAACEPAPTAVTSFQQLRQLPSGTVVHLAPVCGHQLTQHHPTVGELIAMGVPGRSGAAWSVEARDARLPQFEAAVRLGACHGAHLRLSFAQGRAEGEWREPLAIAVAHGLRHLELTRCTGTGTAALIVALEYAGAPAFSSSSSSSSSGGKSSSTSLLWGLESLSFDTANDATAVGLTDLVWNGRFPHLRTITMLVR